MRIDGLRGVRRAANIAASANEATRHDTRASIRRRGVEQRLCALTKITSQIAAYKHARAYKLRRWSPLQTLRKNWREAVEILEHRL